MLSADRLMEKVRSDPTPRICTSGANAGHKFQDRYRGTIHWRRSEKHFEAWCEGRTGYPLVDAAMPFRRIYNPARQQGRFERGGAYVRRYVPELQDVPDEYLAEPWTMPEEVQR